MVYDDLSSALAMEAAEGDAPASAAAHRQQPPPAKKGRRGKKSAEDDEASSKRRCISSACVPCRKRKSKVSVAAVRFSAATY